MCEIWKSVKGYEGLYEVSNMGGVRSLRNGKIMSVSYKKRYCTVALYKDKAKRHFYVHRLVAEVFCEKQDGREVVNHIDNNTHNNKAENLEWVTPKSNTLHSANQGRMKSRENIKKAIAANKGKRMDLITRQKISKAKKGSPSILRKSVVCVETGEIFDSITQAATAVGVSRSSISKCVTDNTAGGYHWKYVNK